MRDVWREGRLRRKLRSIRTLVGRIVSRRRELRSDRLESANSRPLARRRARMGTASSCGVGRRVIVVVGNWRSAVVAIIDFWRQQIVRRLRTSQRYKRGINIRVSIWCTTLDVDNKCCDQLFTSSSYSRGICVSQRRLLAGRTMRWVPRARGRKGARVGEGCRSHCGSGLRLLVGG